MNFVFFSNECPKCKILEERLAEKKISYEISKDTEILKNNNIISFPALKVNDRVLSFYEAVCFLKDFDFDEVIKNGNSE